MRLGMQVIIEDYVIRLPKLRTADRQLDIFLGGGPDRCLRRPQDSFRNLSMAENPPAPTTARLPPRP
jgi:hypothetical protein